MKKTLSGGLIQDIFNNTCVRFDGDYKAYDDFVAQYCNGRDPIDDEQHIARMLRLRDGMDDTSIDYLSPARNGREKHYIFNVSGHLSTLSYPQSDIQPKEETPSKH